MNPKLGDVFADSVFWIGLVNRRDQHHASAAAWSPHVGGTIITTNLVLAETANAVSKKSFRKRAGEFIDHVLSNPGIRVITCTETLFLQGLRLFRDRLDKEWSLIDCVSFVVMEEQGLTDSLTSDDHFRQAGYRALLLEEP